MNKPNAPGEGSELPALDAECEALLERLNPKSWADEGWRIRYVLACRERQLKAALSSPQQEWISMESAPLDGTTIIVDFGRIGVHAVAWDNCQGITIWCVDDRKHGPYALRGYMEDEIKGWMPMPLPAPPVTAEGKDRG